MNADMLDFKFSISAGWWLNGIPELSIFQDLAPFVYYIQCGEFVKIGTSIEPEKRCDQLRRGGKANRPSRWAGNPRLIAYHQGSAHLERKLHHRFAESRDRGEWFRITDELADHVAGVKAQLEHIEFTIHHRRLLDAIENHGWPKHQFDRDRILRDHAASRPALDREWKASAERLTA